MTRRDATRLILAGGMSLARAALPSGTDTAAQGSGPLDQLLERVRTDHALPGLAAAVVRGGDVVWVGTTGVRRQGTAERIRLDDRFHLASCTKSMTATVAALTVHDGRLTWATTLAQGLPGIADRIRPEYRSATLEQLLAHEARMPAYTQPGAQRVEQMRALRGTPAEQRLTFLAEVLGKDEPNNGSGNDAYSNVGYAAAGAMVERATGSSWEELVLRRLAQPLKMRTLGFGYPATRRQPNQPHGHAESEGRVVELLLDPSRELPVCLRPAGAAHCSIGDIARYAADHLNGLVGRTALLPPETYRLLHRSRSGTDSGFTLGWGVRSDRRWGRIHFGAGSGGWFFARIEIVPKEDVAVVAASNSGQAAAATKELVVQVLERSVDGG